MKKNIISLSVLLAASIIIMGSAFAELNASDSDPVSGYMNLIGSFNKQKTAAPYPEYYGGAYINDNNELVVLVKDLNEDTAQSILQTLSGVDVIIEPAAYSYNELTALYEKLNIAIESDDTVMASIFADVTGFGIDDERNKIVVNFNDISDDKIAKFKEVVSDSSAIEYEAGVFATPNFP